MHIGIQAPISHAEAGGGFTFEWDVLRSLLKEIDKRGYQCSLVSHEKPHQIQRELEGRNWIELSTKLFGSTSWRKVARRMPGAVTLARMIRTRNREGDSDEIQIKANLGLDFLIHTGPFVLTTNIPFSTIVWDVEYREYPFFPELTGDGQWEMRERFYKQVLPRAAIIVVGTQVGKEQVKRYFGVPEKNICVLPHPTPSDALSTSAQTNRPTWVPDSPFIIYPAQFWPHKNHVALIRAMAILKSRGTKMTLVLTGSDKGNLAYLKNEIARLGVTNEVQIVGFVKREDLLASYTFATAMVYASYCGPENLPPLEAFAMGCPVIASEIPGSREQLGDNAMLVAPDQPQEFADAIESIMKSPQVKQDLVARGKARASSWKSDDFATRLLDAVDAMSPQLNCWSRSQDEE